VCINALNRLYFATTAGLVFTWRVMLGGEPLKVGEQLDPELWHPGGSVLIGPQVQYTRLQAVYLGDWFAWSLGGKSPYRVGHTVRFLKPVAHAVGHVMARVSYRVGQFQERIL